MSQIIPYRAGLDWPKGDDAATILDANFSTLAKQADKNGLYLKGSAVSAATQTISSTSFVDLTNLKVSVNLTGGLVLVYAIVAAQVSANVGTLQLLNKDTVLDTAAASSSAGGAFVSSSLSMFWAGNLPGGQTVFKVQGKASAGNLTINDYAKSKIYIVEYSKG